MCPAFGTFRCFPSLLLAIHVMSPKWIIIIIRQLTHLIPIPSICLHNSRGGWRPPSLLSKFGHSLSPILSTRTRTRTWSSSSSSSGRATFRSTDLNILIYFLSQSSVACPQNKLKTRFVHMVIQITTTSALAIPLGRNLDSQQAGRHWWQWIQVNWIRWSIEGK